MLPTSTPRWRTWPPTAAPAGIAWHVTSGTVIRAGAGVYFSSNKFRLNTLGLGAKPTWASGDQGVTSTYYWDKGYQDWQRPPFTAPELNTGSTVTLSEPPNLTMAPSNASWNVAISRAPCSLARGCRW